MNGSLLHLTGLQLLQEYNSESEELAQALGMNCGRNRGDGVQLPGIDGNRVLLALNGNERYRVNKFIYTVILINVYETNQNLDKKKGFQQPKNAFQLAGTGEHFMPDTF